MPQIYFQIPPVSASPPPTGQILPFPWMLTTGNMQDMTGGMRAADVVLLILKKIQAPPGKTT